MYNSVGQEIIEEYTEEEDKIWREKHRENMKHYKEQSKDNNKFQDNITDEELWNKLEELELKEELEGELEKNNSTDINMDNSPKSVINNNLLPYTWNAKQENNNFDNSSEDFKLGVNNESSDKSLNKEMSATLTKLDLLQQVLERQNKLGERLEQIKDREKSIKITEHNLISKLDEMEQIEELEDEMDRLDDIIQNEGGEYVEHSFEKVPAQQIKRSVIFADENDSETLEITFKHSEIPPSSEPYNPEDGIQKPSDVYVAFKSLLSEEKPSILKKSKKYHDLKQPIILDTQEKESNNDVDDNGNVIVIKDVIERVDANVKRESCLGAKPTSLFKKKRMQNKS
ncbi:unnamed protein product [Diatraea saccharalis]|uniref:Uncharacterized protein n=1 Tax=Diatraea saccharalis TaxID=40085 RepID=A0A9P0G036_9NEOP|nr:unnamed protein product [Diatraea saccharalis]